jgi:hypothetical protein
LESPALVYSLCFPFILLIVNMYRLYSPRFTISSDGRLPRSFVRSDGVFPNFRTSGRVGSGFEVPRHGCSGFNAFSDDRGSTIVRPLGMVALVLTPFGMVVLALTPIWVRMSDLMAVFMTVALATRPLGMGMVATALKNA